ncbi:hypothetical protein CANARDRAFT_202637 [[Candida] arabinofermentans NRRL YB-2248]|uniref:Uncharacterized protein n=1 Tax=[Candida] arabinofermentans NRRL YB-2248 TaxID=983967 RepID=A0A1E4SW42_9ASCO|nr:hypothetical protein CANARDRAFT_202637 [[Candida] arabinofermentans NRRL YB-2248]
MCRPAVCTNCSKNTWIGCGLHIPLAMSQSSKDTWCECQHPDPPVTSTEYPPKVGTGIAR